MSKMWFIVVAYCIMLYLLSASLIAKARPVRLAHAGSPRTSCSLTLAEVTRLTKAL